MDEQIVPPNSNPEKVDSNLKFEKFKYLVDLIKWFIVSVALVIMTTIIDSGFRDRAAGIQEIQQYDKYVTDLIVLNKEIGPRRLLAQYFATVTASDKLREHWKDYYNQMDIEYKQYQVQDSIIKAALLNLALRTSDTVKILPEEKPNINSHEKPKNSSTQQKATIQILQQQANELNRQLNSNIKVPSNNNVALKSVSILFNTADDGKDMDTRVLITLKNAVGKVVTSGSFNSITFRDNSTNSFEMPLESITVNKNEILNGTLIIQIFPNGHDTWKFKPSIKMTFSDGTEIVQNNFTLTKLDSNNNLISLGF